MHGIGHRFLLDAIASGECPDAGLMRGIQSSAQNDRLFSEYGRVVTLTVPQSAFRGSIEGVVVTSANKQVGRIYASPVVTVMKDEHTRRNRPSMQFPTNPMGTQRTAAALACTHLAVTVTTQRTLPFPTLVGCIWKNKLPETFGNRNTFRAKTSTLSRAELARVRSPRKSAFGPFKYNAADRTSDADAIFTGFDKTNGRTGLTGSVFQPRDEDAKRPLTYLADTHFFRGRSRHVSTYAPLYVTSKYKAMEGWA